MPEQVELHVNGIQWREWSRMSITRQLDGPSIAVFTSPWDPSREDMREAFRPYQFTGSTVSLPGHGPLFTGVIATPRPKVGKESWQVDVVCTSRASVLAECHAPIGSFPLEFSRGKLDTISRSLCSALAVPFDRGTVDVGAPFPKAALKPDQKPWEMLSDLAKQRNVLLADTPKGALTIKAPPSGGGVLDLKEGSPPLSSISATFDGQRYGFSDLTALGSVRLGVRGGTSTARGVAPILRPLNFTADQSDQGDLPKAARGKASRMAGALGTWVATVPTWRTATGALIEPGDRVSLQAPHVMIYRPTTMLVRSVEYQLGKTESAAIEMVLPWAFSDEIPEEYPWD